MNNIIALLKNKLNFFRGSRGNVEPAAQASADLLSVDLATEQIPPPDPVNELKELQETESVPEEVGKSSTLRSKIIVQFKNKRGWAILLVLVVFMVLAAQINRAKPPAKSNADFQALQKHNQKLAEENQRLQAEKRQLLEANQRLQPHSAAAKETTPASPVSVGATTAGQPAPANVDDCAISNKAGAGDALKRCIENFNAISGK